MIEIPSLLTRGFGAEALENGKNLVGGSVASKNGPYNTRI